MKRNLIALIALSGITANAVAMQPEHPASEWKNVPEATSYVPNFGRDQAPNYDFILQREATPLYLP